MITTRTTTKSEGAFTLAELLVAAGVASVVIGLLYTTLTAALNLYTWNAAVNIGHEQGRRIFNEIQREIHTAVSVPQFVDNNLQPVSGAGPAAGVSYRYYAGGPFVVAAKALAGQNLIQVRTMDTFTPAVGMRLVVPSQAIDSAITGATVSGTIASLTLQDSLATDVDIKDPFGASINVLAFFTETARLVLVNGDLRRYGSLQSGSFDVVARGIQTPTPFSFPIDPVTSQPDNRYVSVNLSTLDASSSNRRLGAAKLSLNSKVSCRARFTAGL
jgi:hypothetical protein